MMDKESIVVGLVLGFLIGVPVAWIILSTRSSAASSVAVGIPVMPQVTRNTEEVEWIDHKGMLRTMTVHRKVE